MSSLIVEVCKVEDSVKHPNADKLSIITIKGWNCIVSLNQYKIGDLVVYCPPDSVIPSNLIEKYNLEYLRSNGRVGTVKLRGSISQGLILDVPEGNFKAGDNVAEILGITKYEQPESKYQKVGLQVSRKKLNPFFDKYTDIENIKNYKNVFTESDYVVITEKIHGSNARFGCLPIVVSKSQSVFKNIKNLILKNIFHKTHEFVYGSHNVQLHGDKKNNFYGSDLWGQMAKKYNMKNILEKDMIIYGEIYGSGIQDLTYGLKNKDIDLVVFDIKKNGKYLSWFEVHDFCYKNNLKTVPGLYTGVFYDGIVEKFTNGKSILCPDQIREGCVIKTYYEDKDILIGRKILKSVSTDYLLRKNGTEFK